jgi:hypothetical protein
MVDCFGGKTKGYSLEKNWKKSDGHETHIERKESIGGTRFELVGRENAQETTLATPELKNNIAYVLVCIVYLFMFSAQLLDFTLNQLRMFLDLLAGTEQHSKRRRLKIMVTNAARKEKN